MEINLKEKLRSLRQQKNITQEALANHLGITPQSVGKWERGEGFPDITLLPKIAFYFDVTVDELHCVDQVRVEEAICEYQRQSKICCQKIHSEKAENPLKKIRKILKSGKRHILSFRRIAALSKVLCMPSIEMLYILALKPKQTASSLLVRSFCRDLRTLVKEKMLYNVCAIPTIISIKKKHYIMPI